MLNDFTMRSLDFPTNLSSLILQFSAENGELQKCMDSTTTLGGDYEVTKRSSDVFSARQLEVSVSIKRIGVVIELFNITIACIDPERHAREHSKDRYEVQLEDASSSIVLLATCKTGTPQTSPECVELERRYEKARGLPPENRAHTLNAIGKDYLRLVDNIDNSIILNRAISILDETVQCSSKMDRRGKYITDLSSALLTRFRRVGDAADLDAAVTASRDAVSATDQTDPYAAYALNVYGIALMDHYDQRGDITDLELAISQYKKALEFITKQANRIAVFNNLGLALKSRSYRLDNLKDLEAAIHYHQIVVDLTQDEDPSKSNRLDNLGTALKDRFYRLNNLKDIEAAICHHQMAVELTPDGHPDMPSWLTSLGTALEKRSYRLDDLEGLDAAIYHHQMAVELTQDGDPEKPVRLNYCGNALAKRFNRLGHLNDLEASIRHQQMAVNLIQDGHPNKPLALTSLGKVLEKRFYRLDNLEDLEAAIRYDQMAVDLTQDGHPHKPGGLNRLGRALETRFEYLGNIKDLEAAIHYKQMAVELLPDGHPDTSMNLDSVADAWMVRYYHLNNLEDLEAALRHRQMAIKLIQDNDPDKPGTLGELGAIFEQRFVHVGNTEDLEAAIHHYQVAVNLTPNEHPGKPILLEGLGSSFGTRFDELGNLKDLKAVIYYMQLAVDLTPDGRPEKRQLMNSLGTAFQMRFEQLRNFKDLEVAFHHNQMALKLTPAGHFKKPIHLIYLADTLLSKFQHLDDTSDVEEAIAYYRIALARLPEAHPARLSALTSLASALYSRYKKLRQPGDLLGTYECSSFIANLASVPPGQRLTEAMHCVIRSLEMGISPLPAYQVAINMLPRVAWLGLPVYRQYSQLERDGNIVRHAITAAIKEEEYEKAVEWAENGRSIAWQNFLHLRTPLDELRAAYPELAAQLQSISQRLGTTEHAHDQPSKSQVSLKSMDWETKSTIQLALDWDKAVETVRIKAGFDSFLKSKTFNQLAPAAVQGPIIILNMDHSQCHALVLRLKDDGTIQCTCLPFIDFTHKNAVQLLNDMKGVLEIANVRSRDSRKLKSRAGLAAKAPFERILRSLWIGIVRPIIQNLGYKPQSFDLPRIWWCATGPFAFLPIHAAGIYDMKHQAPGHKLSDYVVSSYTPTISALLENSHLAPEQVEILAVAQANAPGAPSIPNTEIEVERIENLARNVPFTSLTGDKATVDEVLKGMEKSSWVHLACHGRQNVEQRMKSELLLYDGKLELEKLIAKPLPKADFAFLSACQTATGDEKVEEESVHLAAGMLFSGYKGVIATMWSIGDEDAPQIAEDVYRYMLGDGKPDRKRAAHALHYAVKRLREESKANFLAWVPFIHIGR